MPGTHYAITSGIVPAVNGVLNDVAANVIGNKEDTAINTKDDVSSIMRYLKGLMDAVGISTGVGQGLVYYGVVTAVPGADQFTIATLLGLGAFKFLGTNPYYAFVLRDAGGAAAAPEGEMQAISAYVTATGAFTVAASFTAAVAVSDEILILHPAIGALLNSTYGLSALKAILDTSGVILNAKTAAFLLLAGNQQTFTKNITSAANAGAVTVATITTQPCKIKSIVVRSNGATTADLTSISITGGASAVVTFIDTTTGLRANIAAADQQVSWQGRATLAATKTIVITLAGTGATAVNLQVDVEYESIVNGGVLL